MANEWYVQHGGKQYGPLTGANLKKLAAEGKITPTTSVRLGGEGPWVQAARVQGLFAATAAPSNHAAPAKKTPAPGVQQKSAPPSAPPLQPPAPPPRAKPLGMPVARRAPLPKAVPTDTGSLTPKIVGGVSLILGTLALSTCWLPVMGGLIAWTGIVTGALGLIVGIVGFALAAIHKGSGLMLNISAVASGAAGLVLSVVAGVAFGMFTSAPTPAPPVLAKVIPQVVPEPIKPAEPEPEPEPQWFDASQPIQQGDIKAQVMAVGIENIRLEAADLSTVKKGKPQPMLKIKVAVENTSTEKIVEFAGWVGGGELIPAGVGQLLGGTELGKAVQSATPTAQLTDNIGNKYKQTPSVSIFGAGISLGTDNALRPGKSVESDLVFPEPLPSIEYLRLELSPAAYAGSEPLRFQIPRAMIKGFAPPPAAAAPPAEPTSS